MSWGLHSHHKPVSRNVLREDTSTTYKCFWEATGGESMGGRAAELTFADLIFKSAFLA